MSTRLETSRRFASHRAALLIAASAGALFLAGCSDSGNSEQSASEEPVSSEQTAAITGTDQPQANDEGTAGTAAPTAPAEAPQLAQAESGNAGSADPSSGQSSTQSSGSSGASSAPDAAAQSPASAEQPMATSPLSTSAPAPEPDGTVDMQALLDEQPIDDIVMGSEDAPVTIVEYASLTCGHCSAFHEQTWPQLKSDLIDTGQVRFILRPFPLDPRATAGAMLARCGSNDNYYDVIDLLFDRQNVWARAAQDQAAISLYDTVKLAGFSQQSFDSCLQNNDLLQQINATREAAANEFGVNATPTFFIDGGRYPGARSFEEISAIVRDAQQTSGN